MNSKVCVIVGVGAGAGLSIARRFGRDGYRIGLIARCTEAMQACLDDLRRNGIEVYGFSVDDFEPHSLVAVFEKLKLRLGDVSVLIYNACSAKQTPPSNLDAADLLASFKINVAGALVAAQQVIPSMRTRGCGTILFTGGGLRHNPEDESAALAIGRAAIQNLSYSLASELEPAGIRVAAITPCARPQSDAYFDTDAVAEQYWKQHCQKVA
jgi:short-subunit dehydrogenase